MKIDRHNYEEFFILYWDNELTAVQKQAVENFVNQNADLREEFEILGETRFTPEATEQFKEKDFLLNDSFINITNYEEQLLNYIDDEVTNEERKEVERFVSANTEAQKELALLQKTKLQPEAEISFPDKSVLYRREEKPVRVIRMTWFRVAVAAAIILIAGFTVLQFVNSGKPGNTDPVARATETQKFIDNKVPDPNKTSVATTTEQSIPGNNERVKNDSEKKPTIDKEDKIKLDESSLTSTQTKGRENKNNLPEPRTDLIANNQNTASNEVVVSNLPDLKKADRVPRTESTAPVYTSLTESDVTKKSMPALNIPDDVVAKEKDGGGLKEFLRKTTRVFERRTKIQTTTEDNKLLVGAFAVSLK
jgi:hypothetical protein